MSLLRAEVRRETSASTVALHGELDISTAADAEREIRAAERANPGMLVLPAESWRR